MIRSLPVGRLANVTSALLVVNLVNVALGALVALGLYASGVESLDLHGSLLYGAVLAVSGIFFTALTALVAQLTETSRGTLGLDRAVLGRHHRGAFDAQHGSCAFDDAEAKR